MNNKNKKLSSEWNNKKDSEKLEAFASALDKAVLSYPSLIKRSIIAGLFTGLGATVGVAFVFLIVTIVLRILGYVPLFNDFIDTERLNQQLNQLNPKK